MDRGAGDGVADCYRYLDLRSQSIIKTIGKIDSSKERRNKGQKLSESGFALLLDHPPVRCRLSKHIIISAVERLGEMGRRGTARAQWQSGCLLSRGGPVSSRRDRNLGVEQEQGGPGGPPFYFARSLRAEMRRAPVGTGALFAFGMIRARSSCNRMWNRSSSTCSSCRWAS